MIQSSNNYSKNPITAVIVGSGHRSLIYASYSQRNPERLKIVGVAEPDEFRRKMTAELYGIPEENCFKSAEELSKNPKIADAVINGTMDKEHVNTSIPLLKAGYHILLEKPISTNEKELLELYQTAKETKRNVMICHVLRYNPYYIEIKNKVAAGEIGEIMNIQTAEHVSYHHVSVSYVRDKWNKKEACGSGMLLAKSCHDLDIIAWLKSGIVPIKVNSMGSRMFFRKEKAPEGSGTRCLVDCPIEPSCLYSAKKIYLDHPRRWDFYVWRFLDHIKNPTIKQKEESLKTDNPHGRCIWKCENNVVDHQSVVVEFEDGSTATHNLVGGASKGSRKIHLLGTKGEITGPAEGGGFIIRHPDPSPGNKRGYVEEKVEINYKDIPVAHGGHLGDLLLVEDFVNVLSGEKPSISTTNLEDSIYGHLIGFRADKSMEESRVLDMRL